ncbi:unnamed protein product [Rotaria magnacalcarata]|uniref:Uncharacterized protein n=1 Tax=Rotaria magnacalcarata TaxID=392030 RepID=A0A8S2M7T2_9BILA|nr:unnamed protein product [Rotaria magnacalcarata]
MPQFKSFIIIKRLSYRFGYAIGGIFVALCLIATIALLIGYLIKPMHLNSTINQKHLICPPNPCLSTTGTNSSSTSSLMSTSTTSKMTMSTSISTAINSSMKPTSGLKSTYKESCNQLYDCYIEYGLLCEYGWNENKSCLCEGSHYWSARQNQCSQTTVRRIVDCTNEDYATTCLVLGTNNIYHMVTVRSITEKELSFDWFLIDNRLLEELPQLSCTVNNETKYCFGLAVQDSQHSLKLAQFTRKGFHSIENIGSSNRGTAFGLTNINSVAVYVRNSQNTLYRRIIADDEVLSAHDIAFSLSGDPMCYIHELSISRQIYCFARNAVNGLTEYAELSTNTWRATQLGNPTDRIRDETAPVCSYVGQIHRYCFAIFENGQIYRILWKSGVWSTWQSIGRDRQYQFITQPTFLTSKPLNESSLDQICYLLAIDTNSNLQLSTNSNCAQLDSFTEWTPISTNLKFKQFDKIFRLRDGNIGVLGIDSQNRPYYLYLDPKTSHFTSPRLAFTVKSEEFRP